MRPYQHEKNGVLLCMPLQPFGKPNVLIDSSSSMLRLGFSAMNEHRFRYNFQCISSMCACNTEIEDNAHVFLHFPMFDSFQNDLLGQLSPLPELDLSNISPQALLYLILYGSPTPNESKNRRILEALIIHIEATNRLN